MLDQLVGVSAQSASRAISTALCSPPSFIPRCGCQRVHIGACAHLGGARLSVTPRRRSLEVSQSISARSTSQPEPVCRRGVNRDRTLPFRILAYAPLPKLSCPRGTARRHC